MRKFIIVVILIGKLLSINMLGILGKYFWMMKIRIVKVIAQMKIILF